MEKKVVDEGLVAPSVERFPTVISKHEVQANQGEGSEGGEGEGGTTTGGEGGTNA